MEGPRILPAAETLTLHGVLRGSVHGAEAVDLTAPVLAGALGAAVPIPHDKAGTIRMNDHIDLDSGHLRMKKCRHGFMLYNIKDYYIGGSLDRYGEFSEGEVTLFRQIVQPGMTVVEAGANIGVHTIALAAMVGANGRVIAFEPQRVVFQMLCANLALNGIETVEAHCAAVGQTPGKISVPPRDYRSPGNFGAVELTRTGGEKVEVVSIDSLGLHACHLIKADVEGMEVAVLRGARRTIGKHRPMLYVENDRPAGHRELVATILAQGYRAWWHTPLLFNPRNFAGNPQDAFPSIGSVNLICLPQERMPTLQGAVELRSPDQPHPFVTG